MIKREIPAKQKSINSSDEIPQIKSRNTANIFVYLLNFCRWTQQLLLPLLLLCVTLIALLRRYATVCQIRFIVILQSILPLKDIFLRSFFSLVLCSLEFLFGSFYKRSRSEYSGFFLVLFAFPISIHIERTVEWKQRKLRLKSQWTFNTSKTNGTQVNVRVCAILVKEK